MGLLDNIQLLGQRRPKTGRETHKTSCQTALRAGRILLEWVAELNWNQWPDNFGTGGRIPLERAPVPATEVEVADAKVGAVGGSEHLHEGREER